MTTFAGILLGFEKIVADFCRNLTKLPKAAYRRVAVTPPPPASRRPGGGGVTAYMPRKAACWQWSAEGRKEAGGRGDEERDEAEEKKVELAT